MVMERAKSLVAEVEEKFGLPRLSQATEALDKLPDEKRLRAIKEVLIAAEAVSRSAPELNQVISLIREINSLPTEKMDKLLQILRKIEKIMKTAPPDLLDFLAKLKEE